MGNNSSAYSMYKGSRYSNNGTIEPILSTIQDKSKQLEVENNIRVIKEKYANKSVINIVLYGPRKVGKTALLRKFLYNLYGTAYNPSTEIELAVKIIKCHKIYFPFSLRIFDTPGEIPILEQRVLFENVDVVLFMLKDDLEFLKEGVIMPYTQYLRECIKSFSKKASLPESPSHASHQSAYVAPNLPVIFYVLTHKDLIEKDEFAVYNGKVNEVIADLKKKNVIDPLNNHLFTISTQNIGEVQAIFKEAVYIMNQMKNNI